MSLELSVALALLPIPYVLVWPYWVRPRLTVLRREAALTHYRVPWQLVAGYVLAEVVAPLTLAVLVGYLARDLAQVAIRRARSA